MLETAIAADRPALLGLTLLAHLALMVDSSSVTPFFVVFGWPLRNPALHVNHCRFLLLTCARINLAPRAIFTWEIKSEIYMRIGAYVLLVRFS